MLVCSKFNIAFLLIACLAMMHSARGATVVVQSAGELATALDNASGGDSIQLAPGNYGDLDIFNRSFSSYVTLTSQSDNDRAVFHNVEFQNSSYVRLENFVFSPSGREGVGIFAGSHHIQVVDSEVHGQAQFNRSAPVYTQVSTLYGININGGIPGNTGQTAHHVLIENIDVHDIKSSGYLIFSVRDSVIRENKCDWTAADCYKLAGADGILFENNFGARHIYASPTAHVDFVQGQGAVSNSTFRGNVAIRSTTTTHGFQGLFFDDATFTNLTFENNLIYTTAIRGISVSSPAGGTPSTGIVATNNTVLIPGGAQKASLILLPGGSIKNNNIEGNNVTKNADRFNGTNIVAQWDDDDDIAHYDDYYINADRGLGAEIADFRPVEGSVAEDEVGAFARIFELLDGVVIDPDPPENAGDEYQVIPVPGSGVIVLPM